MRIGERATLHRRFCAEDLTAFAALSGAGPTAGRVPDPLIAGLFSQLLGTRLPGPGSGWLKQELNHLATALEGERLHAEVEVTRLRPEKNLVDLMCICTGNDGRLLCHGRALMLLQPRSALQS